MKLLVTVLVALGLVAGGCASSRPTFAPEQSIPVEIRSTSPVTIFKCACRPQ